MGKENVPHLTSAAKAGSENKPAIAAVNRCATQNPMRHPKSNALSLFLRSLLDCGLRGVSGDFWFSGQGFEEGLGRGCGRIGVAELGYEVRFS
jgi:hypothetical protein